ncbi:MAG: energy transducer TonB [Microbacterium sp.]|uniref:carboxypeptidase regulatory-like domain-containing protein n=1 Tax=Microbacterium sp. TaxID=51671 RepID=UPI001D50797A|nr:carboxypeptidase regulatory-like domain-containing protein [Microbacterium sp.]MBW8764624.1 energy transducer TonB [Microbacterium sp.]
MTSTRWCRTSVTAFALALCWPNHISAQTEAGVARDAKSGAPLECLHVALVDSTNRAVAHTVTDATGQFQLEAPRPGSYRVRFELFGWEPLGGPLDTLGDGDFKQRRYPLDFVNLMLPKGLPLRSILDTAESVHKQHDREEKEAYNRFYRELRQKEDSAAWSSRSLASVRDNVHYPEGLRRQGVQGSVVEQVIIDSAGRARAGTWQVLRSAHQDFEKAVRSDRDKWQWRPALLAGKPVCELTRGVVEFSLDRTVPGYDWANIRFMF